MVALRLVALLLLVGSVALPAHADVFPYEAVGIGGSNNTVDSNASSCDQTGTPGTPGEGCYTRTGTKCLDNPNQLCDLQIVPAGRCTYGNLATGLASCVWPHRAGRCAGNIKVGCLTSTECSGLTPTTCDLAFDKFGRAADPNDVATCTCTNANATSVCAGSLSVCSDGDPMRAVGGLGVGLGVELHVTVGAPTFPNMGPAFTGSSTPKSTPPFAIESPPSNFDPQRDAGTIARTPQGTGLIHQARATDAREIEAYVHPTIANPGPGPLNVRKVTSLGDSYWGDWVFVSTSVAPPLNSHIVTYPCNAPSGYATGTPINGAGQYCHQAPYNGIGFLWQDDLTAAQKTAYSISGVPVCPPHCYKDFNTSTMELQELTEVGLADPEAAIQLALQSGEPAASRVAGARDSLGAAAITSITYLTDVDLRCRLGGWGNAAGFVGRCSDGASACDPDAANCGMGGACCSGQGGSCSACIGPFNAVTNPLGLPIGYNTHGYPQLDLVAGERIGGVSSSAGDVRVPLFVVGTSGNAASDFRDIAGESSSAFDLADMGPAQVGSQVAGIGAGGTFVNGTTLNIDEPCCGTGAGSNVVWDAGTSLGTVVAGFEDGFSYRFGPGGGDVFLSDWSLTYDKGAGPDGIPGCIGDNLLVLNGSGSCDNRLGVGAPGAKTDAFFATGLDDRTIMYPIGATSMPASGPRFKWRDADPSVVAFFGLAQNPPTTNGVAAFTLRDLAVLVPRSADVLVKVNTTQCPLTDAGPQCTLCDDPDGDLVCADADNCLNVANPIVPGGATAYLAANPWATLTGGQRDDDHDGYGNICDGDFGNNGTTTAADTAQYKAALGRPKAGDTCGTTGIRPCAIFDINAANSTESSAGGISAADTARYKQVLGFLPGARCPACPLPCVAGTAGTCF